MLKTAWNAGTKQPAVSKAVANWYAVGDVAGRVEAG
jgi:hypothetical protein